MTERKKMIISYSVVKQQLNFNFVFYDVNVGKEQIEEDIERDYAKAGIDMCDINIFELPVAKIIFTLQKTIELIKNREHNVYVHIVTVGPTIKSKLFICSNSAKNMYHAKKNIYEELVVDNFIDKSLEYGSEAYDTIVKTYSKRITNEVIEELRNERT